MHREPIRLGISACLLGERVRFDGGHKRDPFLVETLGPFVEPAVIGAGVATNSRGRPAAVSIGASGWAAR